MSSLAIVRPEAGIAPPALLEVSGRSVETTTHYRRAAAAWIAWAKGRPLTAHLFAAWIDADYVKRHGELGFLAEYGAGLS